MTDAVGEKFVPQPSLLRKEAVSSLAEDVAQRLGDRPGGEINDIIQKLGGTVSYRNIWAEVADDGSLLISSPGSFEIVLPATTSFDRDRFTVAHELGHYVLHYLFPKQANGLAQKARFTRYGSTKLEWEANWFAAAFLMPRDQFI